MSTDAPAAPLPGTAPSTRLVRHKKATLRNLTILVIAGEFVALGGYFSWHKDNPELAKAFGEAAAALLFGSMLGAVVQVLFNDLELTRAIRAARAEFISNVLADLKSVHDRVERARSLILAHQSAKTYGEEIRDLIEYRVKLHNVARAIQFDPRGEVLRNIAENVRTMRSYLDVIVKEFESSYKEISRKQSQYESDMKAALDKPGEKSQPGQSLPDNSPWEEIRKLPSITNWISRDGNTKPSFEHDFLAPLDSASRELRQQLILSMN